MNALIFLALSAVALLNAFLFAGGLEGGEFRFLNLLVTVLFVFLTFRQVRLIQNDARLSNSKRKF